MKPKKHSAESIVRQALNWGAESIEQMIECHRKPDGTLPVGDEPWAEHTAYLVSLHKQMVAYRKKRFGWKYDPTSDAKLVDARTELQSLLTKR